MLYFAEMVRRAWVVLACSVVWTGTWMVACGSERRDPSMAGPLPNPEQGRADADASATGGAGASAGAAGAGDPGQGGAAGVSGEVARDAGSSSLDADVVTGPDAAVALVPGSLEVSWMHGAASCAQSMDPELQVHAYNESTYIIRQDKCRTFEAPFVYLVLGAERALLLDTGATPTAALRDTVMPLVGARSLLVAHTHAHGDHVASDDRFVGQPSTTVVGTTVGAVQAAFGIDPWPTGAGEVDLGGRVLDVLGIPGHEQTHIALYDRETGLLFTGDSLYPGLLFISDWTVYRASMQRLADFVATHAIAHVLGAHVEMTSTAGINYPYGTVFQPAEHVLQLEATHVAELNAALIALGPVAPSQPVAHDDFVIDPQ
jgi:hydroxyacylglutathione hydrolase